MRDVNESTSRAPRLGAMLGALVLCALALPASADDPQTLAEAFRDRQVGNTQVRQAPADLETAPADEAARLAETWGIEISSIRLAASHHMIDYRFRVLDADKAADLFQRQVKPQLIHQETGIVLKVPDTSKVGPLRNSNVPQNDRIYWMFFGNAGQLVEAGDKVTVVIGDCVVEDLVVE